MTYWQDAPDPYVAGVVSRVTFSAEDTPSNEVFRVLPDGGTDLLLSIDERSGHAALEVFGVKTTALLVRDDAPVQKLAFHLRPSAARRVLGVSAAEVRDRSVSLATLWGRRGELLLEQLVTLRGWRARRALVATAVASLGDAARRRAPLVERALVLIDRSDGRIPVEALARRLGADRRTLERAFREDVGVSPKVYSRTVRFHAARKRLEAGGSAADVAGATGYADQAHMVREFRAIAGCTPGALLSGRR